MDSYKEFITNSKIPHIPINSETLKRVREEPFKEFDLATALPSTRTLYRALYHHIRTNVDADEKDYLLEVIEYICNDKFNVMTSFISEELRKVFLKCLNGIIMEYEGKVDFNDDIAYESHVDFIRPFGDLQKFLTSKIDDKV